MGRNKKENKNPAPATRASRTTCLLHTQPTTTSCNQSPVSSILFISTRRHLSSSSTRILNSPTHASPRPATELRRNSGFPRRERGPATCKCRTRATDESRNEDEDEDESERRAGGLPWHGRGRPRWTQRRSWLGLRIAFCEVVQSAQRQRQRPHKQQATNGGLSEPRPRSSQHPDLSLSALALALSLVPRPSSPAEPSLDELQQLAAASEEGRRGEFVDRFRDLFSFFFQIVTDWFVTTTRRSCCSRDCCEFAFQEGRGEVSAIGHVF